uniref:Uncharacterized protein n=1 Tax=Lotus japonicus TaxID=34305 RepID=I3S3E9_LOTJA|nr:unknown [Lotus japonicus]
MFPHQSSSPQKFTNKHQIVITRLFRMIPHDRVKIKTTTENP